MSGGFGRCYVKVKEVGVLEGSGCSGRVVGTGMCVSATAE